MKTPEIKEYAEKLGLERFPENWQNEIGSFAIQPKQIDYNKSDRDSFIEGYVLAFTNLHDVLKDNLSIEINNDSTNDFGNTYRNIDISVYLGSEKITSASTYF